MKDSQEAPREPQEAPRRPPRGPEEAPKRPPKDPKRPQNERHLRPLRQVAFTPRYADAAAQASRAWAGGKMLKRGRLGTPTTDCVPALAPEKPPEADVPGGPSGNISRNRPGNQAPRTSCSRRPLREHEFGKVPGTTPETKPPENHVPRGPCSRARPITRNCNCFGSTSTRSSGENPVNCSLVNASASVFWSLGTQSRLRP